MQSALRTTLAAALLAGCGGARAATSPSPTSAGDETTEAPSVAAAAPAEEGPIWLAAMAADTMLSYRVEMRGEAAEDVHMLVQQRVERGGSVAVRLAPIGTPLEGTPVYPQWLVGAVDGLRGLEEYAAFTTPGFVPIDAEGRLLTEAASAEAWRVEPSWLRPGVLSSGGEAAVGWTLLERVATIDEPLHAERCVRLERAEGEVRTRQLVCSDVGVVELSRTQDDTVVEEWRLVSVGARPSEPQELE